MPWGIDQVQDIVAAILPAVGQPDRLRLDGDAPLPLDIHPVEVLGPHRAGIDHPGGLEHAVSQGGLAMVNMGDDAEIPDNRGVGGTGLREGHLGSFG